MNIDRLVKTRIDALDQAIDQAKKAKTFITEEKERTVKFLSECKSLGIKKVAIHKSHESVPSSVNFTFGCFGSVFSDEPNRTTSPQIWEACHRMGINSCGNSNQYQVSSEMMIDGVYHFSNGSWKRIED